MNLRYLLGSLISIPLLPFIYFQGKRIKKEVPRLPEATHPQGIAGMGIGKKLTVLCIGESTFAGVGVNTHEEGFAGALGRHLSETLKAEIHWKVYAKSGYNSQQVKEEILPLITETSADLIVIGMGGNDAFELNTPWNWTFHTQGIINQLKQKFPNTPIVFGNMPPIKEFPAFTPLIRFVIGNLGEILGEELAKLVKGKKDVYYYGRIVALKDWAERLNIPTDPSLYFSDGVHPSGFTYQIWAEDLINYLLEIESFRNSVIQVETTQTI